MAAHRGCMCKLILLFLALAVPAAQINGIETVRQGRGGAWRRLRRDEAAGNSKNNDSKTRSESETDQKTVIQRSAGFLTNPSNDNFSFIDKAPLATPRPIDFSAPELSHSPSKGPSTSPSTVSPSEGPSESSTPNPSVPPTSKPSVQTARPSFSTEPSTSPSVELETFSTTFRADSTYAGNMFDIVARENIAISKMGIHTYVKIVIDVHIYTRAGSYMGAETDLSEWTLLLKTAVKGRGMGVPTLIPEAFDPPVLIKQNEKRSFYVTTNGPWLRATKGTKEGDEVYSNSRDEYVSLFQGVGKRYPIQAGTRRARIWNGLMKYRVVENIPPQKVVADDSVALGKVTFRRGDLAVKVRHLGIRICTGMSVRVIARANRRVRLSNGGYSGSKFHAMPDAAAVLPLEGSEGGYAYVSNSEMKKWLGGVYSVVFDKDGNVVDYKQLLSGTMRNCGGGVTPWGTWLSCEEYPNGQCWQVDPKGQIVPQITKLGGAGGNYESVATDKRNPSQPIFYVTEDHVRGALRKYTPPASPTTSFYTLHAEGGSTRYLRFLKGNRFEWTDDEDGARDSQQQHFPNVEGIDCHNGYLYFVSKKLLMLYILDLDSGTYETSSTNNGVLVGDGEFQHQPDQVVRNNEGDYLYLTEDGGKTAGVYAIHKLTGRRYAIFEAYGGNYKNDETTGLAFSLDGNKMYASFQDCGCRDSKSGSDFNCGCLFEFSRADGRSFDGSSLNLKFH